jgi:ABC-type arginine transport system ATPase subunit
MEKLTVFTNVQANGVSLAKTTVTTIATAGAVTYSAAEILGGLILRDPAGAGRADLVPTAAALYSELGSPVKYAGLSFDFTIRNTADAAETITLTTNTGMTMSGTMTIAQNNSKAFRVVFATPTAATVYSLGTVVS